MRFKLSKTKSLWFGLLGWLLLSTGIQAETIVLQLKNGDRLTGTLISENTNQVVISTSWIKELTIPKGEISKTEKTVASTTTGTNAVANEKITSPSVSDTEKKKLELAKAKSWHGKIDLGMDLNFNEKNPQLYYGTAKIVYAPEKPTNGVPTISQRFKNTFDYSATYGKTEGTTSANRMDGSTKTDFDVRKKLFVYNQLSIGYDQIRAIDFQYEIGPGLGYHLFSRTNAHFNTELGANYQVQSLKRNMQNERFFVRFAEDFDWKITKKLSWDEKLELLPSIDSFRSFRFRFESNLRYALLGNLSLTFSILDQYDTKPATGIGKNDLLIRSLVGVTF